MIAFSTDEFAPNHRFDHWREVRGKQLFGVTIELEPEDRAEFSGSFSASTVGGATLATINASAYRVSRTGADIARLAGDSLVVAQQVVGPGWCDIGDGDPFFVGNGGFLAGYSDFGFASVPSTRSHFRYRTVKIPIMDRPWSARSVQRMPVAPFTADTDRYSRLIAASISALFDGAVPPAEAELSVDALARLVLIARSGEPPGSPESRQALRTAHLHALRQILRSHSHRMDLSAELVARMLAVSTRHVHVILEPTGASFMATLTAIRVEEACRLLVAKPNLRVADIGFACGFPSLATFYRAFQRLMGHAPNDYRQMQLRAALQ
jgi:AraC-like DNA-binding protein